uniref:Uncharacterized protein n=1 Tax=Zea mays TaxID=4577 RepID=B4FMM7_MAIZE|nr:unknown [Zea mays]
MHQVRSLLLQTVLQGRLHPMMNCNFKIFWLWIYSYHLVKVAKIITIALLGRMRNWARVVRNTTITFLLQMKSMLLGIVLLGDCLTWI